MEEWARGDSVCMPCLFLEVIKVIIVLCFCVCVCGGGVGTLIFTFVSTGKTLAVGGSVATSCQISSCFSVSLQVTGRKARDTETPF